MPQTRVKIILTKRGNAPPRGIALPRSLYQALGIPPSDHMLVRVGAFVERVPVVVSQLSGRVTVGNQLADELYVPLPKTLWVRYDASAGMLHIGPVVAIFSCTRKGANARSRSLFGVRTGDVRQLLRHARRINLLAFALAPEGVDASEPRYVYGYVLSGKRWQRRRLPFPDVVYDRIQARSWERRPETIRAKEMLRNSPHTAYFNEGFFDKWTVHEKMMKHEVLAEFLPPTEKVTDAESLRNFLTKYPSAFLKPTEGSQGKGIVRIRKHGQRYSWRRGGRVVRHKNLDSLYRYVRRLQRGKTYIIQPDLRLATFGGRPFDVRILWQRDGAGRWRRTKTYARVAARGQLTSNLSRGGDGIGLAWALRRTFGKSGRRIYRRVRQSIRTIIEHMEEVFDSPLGEIGLDIGIDKRGRVWVIEVNSKPFRKLDSWGAYLSYRRPMAFSRHLAGF